jgi:hypothetical protein
VLTEDAGINLLCQHLVMLGRRSPGGGCPEGRPLGGVGKVVHQTVQPCGQSCLVGTSPGVVVAILIAVSWRDGQCARIWLRRRCWHDLHHSLHRQVSQAYKTLIPAAAGAQPALATRW